jgi:hypothetical protein
MMVCMVMPLSEASGSADKAPGYVGSLVSERRISVGMGVPFNKYRQLVPPNKWRVGCRFNLAMSEIDRRR